MGATLFHQCTSTERGKCQVRMRLDILHELGLLGLAAPHLPGTVRYAHEQQQAQTSTRRSPTSNHVNIKGTTDHNILSTRPTVSTFIQYSLREARSSATTFIHIHWPVACSLLNVSSTRFTIESITVMVTSTSFVAACSIFALSCAAPIRHNVATHAKVARGTYVMFGGDGTTATGWPSRESWLSFDDAW